MKVFEVLDEALCEWIARQRVFFVATAPGGAAGHINCSPKGLDSLRVLGPREVAYLDFTGSGAETIAHLRDNGRIVLMFCAFEGPPRILRLHGRGEAVEPPHSDYFGLAARLPRAAEPRCIVRVAVQRIADSCGYGVPLMSFEAERAQLPAWCERKGPDGLRDYQRAHNLQSLDGLPALRGG
ncbi:MAG: pyridoxamine 5'-phosphate oxidase family protein [Deltaproteobacteria bacterium]|nr:pyridoxamine 5'-phosphate oxidase family protein [Deltaproteobacteria bacterium]